MYSLFFKLQKFLASNFLLLAYFVMMKRFLSSIVTLKIDVVLG